MAHPAVLLSRFALVLEYDGTGYAGSQLQKGVPTVQGVLEQALTRIAGERLRTAFAGRTDAGVHARGQVAAFSSERRLQPGQWQAAINGNLPADVAVVAAREVAPGFDPRRQARQRWYRYTILNQAGRSPLMRFTTWQVGDRLDLAQMRRAARVLAGRHDFAAFCGSIEEGRTTVRTVFETSVTKEPPLIWIDVSGDAFLPQQVRRMAGALVRVGAGRMQVGEFEATLRGARPGSSAHVAPAAGLCLMRIDYEGIDFGNRYEDL
ncbi:MAG: tRNA pseudouridine(38-40) synthase TruA [Dehalococcoidia bacterium]|nr:tRNA pseudouridine(38-40) synthase TruA [Dehalococcoidia bacterium]